VFFKFNEGGNMQVALMLRHRALLRAQQNYWAQKAEEMRNKVVEHTWGELDEYRKDLVEEDKICKYNQQK
jgi:hypothetical protein